MPEFLTLMAPNEARELLLSQLDNYQTGSVVIPTNDSLDRITAEDVVAPHVLPEFARSSVDGYALRSRDSHGASESLPALFKVVGELEMGKTPDIQISAGACALIHTGGMLPTDADAVVMIENTQKINPNEVEVLRAIAAGENVIQVGEDITKGQIIIERGCRLRPADLGGLMALGITNLKIASKVKVGLISTGDELVAPEKSTQMGQVRDINTYTLGALVIKSGGIINSYGIVRDEMESLRNIARTALDENDILLITAGSSASVRDITAEVIQSLGKPGVLVHGINTRPGKPTILGMCDGKPVIGLPGNPVSALVNGYLFVVPVIQKLTGEKRRAQGAVLARLSMNIPSQAGREDWVPVKLREVDRTMLADPSITDSSRDPNEIPRFPTAEPIFGKSNLIFNLVNADGLLRIPESDTGLTAGTLVEVTLI
jgi:molybdopterin molybdotransferase